MGRREDDEKRRQQEAAQMTQGLAAGRSLLSEGAARDVLETEKSAIRATSQALTAPRAKPKNMGEAMAQAFEGKARAMAGQNPTDVAIRTQAQAAGDAVRTAPAPTTLGTPAKATPEEAEPIAAMSTLLSAAGEEDEEEEAMRKRMGL